MVRLNTTLLDNICQYLDGVGVEYDRGIIDELLDESVAGVIYLHSNEDELKGEVSKFTKQAHTAREEHGGENNGATQLAIRWLCSAFALLGDEQGLAEAARVGLSSNKGVGYGWGGAEREWEWMAKHPREYIAICGMVRNWQGQTRNPVYLARVFRSWS